MKIKNKLLYSLAVILIVFFLFIVYKGLELAQPGDENVYYYMAKLVAEGKVPYRDFFYAHPPLHIYILALFYSVFEFNIAVLKLVPLISTVITAFFIFRIAMERFGRYEALIAVILFLFSYSIMFNSVFSFGVMTAAMLLAIGYYFLGVKNNYFIAGMFFGLAGVTRLLSIIPAAVMISMVFLSNKRNFLKVSSSFLFIFLLVNAVFLAIAGSPYIDSVYKYHLLKSPEVKDNLNEYQDTIKLNWILFLSAILYVLSKEKKKASAFAIIPIIYFVFLVFLKRLFGFYFVIAFPFLAILGAFSIVSIYKSINLGNKAKAAIISVLLLVFAWNLGSDAFFLWKVGFKGFERGNDLADFIRLRSNENAMLFGDESVTPLLALMTGKKIAFDLADTNIQIFGSGLINIGQVLENIKKQDVIFIARSTQGIAAIPEVMAFLNDNCDLLSQFHDSIEGDYLVYQC